MTAFSSSDRSSYGDHRLLPVHPPTQPQARAGPPTSRSRNGCVTCKKRHVRCDERKPTCFRCQKAGVGCDGYSLKAGSVVRTARQTTARPILPAARESREQSATVLLAPPSNCPFQGVDVTYFDVFRHEVVYDILSTGYKDFWNRALVRDGLEIDYIRHSILALGALSLCVNENANNQDYPSRDWTSTPSPGLHYNAALRHHVKALALFGRRMSQKGKAVHPRTILLITSLFVAFEYLHGNNLAAIDLIDSGLLLLAQRSFLPEAGSLLTKTASGDTEYQEFVEDAPRTFARFGIVGLLTPFVPLETRFSVFGGGSLRARMPDINARPEELFELWRDFVFSLTKFSADIEFVTSHPNKVNELLPKTREPIKAEDIPQRLMDEMTEISLWKEIIGHHCRIQTDPVVCRWLHIAKVQLLGIECITQDVTGMGGAPDYWTFLAECEALQDNYPPNLQSRLTYDGIINMLMNTVFWSQDRAVCRRALETAQRYTRAHMDRERVAWIRRNLRHLLDSPETWQPRSDWIGAGCQSPDVPLKTAAVYSLTKIMSKRN